MPTLKALGFGVFRRNQRPSTFHRQLFSGTLTFQALTTLPKRHKEKVFRGDLAGRLAATLKNSLK